jgi:ubiquinone/menaquinone biosynthesis C-methylase UbiE
MGHAAYFWDKIAEGYAKRPVADQGAYERKLATTQRYLRADMEVLEFGCGTGTTALHHAPFVKHIRAIDVSGKMIGIARSKAETKGVTNVTFEQSDIDGLSGADECYDAVMGHSILHLLDDRSAVIENVHRMLKPGGVFITSTACLGGTMPWLRVILPVGRFLGLLPMVRFFTPAGLAGEFESAGFGIEHTWQPDRRKALFVVARKA